MKILILTFGTRGDLQPYVALGIGLKKAGHTVGICTSEGYKTFVEEHQLSYVYMSNELLQLTEDSLAGTGGIAGTFKTVKAIPPAVRRMMDDEWNAALTFQPDLIIYHTKCLGSLHVAEKLKIPAMASLPLPFYTPTKAFPVPFMSGIHLGAWFNLFSYKIMGLTSGMYVKATNDFRNKVLGLPPIAKNPDLFLHADGSRVPILYPYSPSVLPIPEDFPPDAHVTGYWFLDSSSDWQPDPELVKFLKSGPSPVYIGFGSMGGVGGDERAKVVLEALKKSGQRGLIAKGWGGLKASDFPDDVFMLDTVPHDWLFPQVAAVVHHGGAGTTAAGLRAGKPSIVCPFLGDQGFWGDVVHQLGAGPKPIPQRRLTADRLADAIKIATQDVEMQRRANEIGQKIRKEDGIARAVEVIEAFTVSK
jgi:sterol 3beta-glucosyltransferase